MKKILIVLMILVSTNLFAYKQIEIMGIKRNNSYVEVTVTMRFPYPAALIKAGVPLANAAAVLATYGNYVVDTTDVNHIAYTLVVPISIADPTLKQVQDACITSWTTQNTALNGIVLKPYDVYIYSYYDGSSWITK